MQRSTLAANCNRPVAAWCACAAVAALALAVHRPQQPHRVLVQVKLLLIKVVLTLIRQEGSIRSGSPATPAAAAATVKLCY
jgi:hypothetical protein